MTKSPQPPAHLSPAAKKLWRDIHDQIEVDAAAVLVLDTLATQFDRATEARKILTKEGLTVTDRFGQSKANPAAIIERDAIMAMLRCYKTLGLDMQPPMDSGSGGR